MLGEEEGPSDLDAEHVWVLDPIDGTAAFIAGMPVYGTLIALMQAGEPIIGIIDHPITGERWLGVNGQRDALQRKALSHPPLRQPRRGHHVGEQSGFLR